ncbi:MAG TPA: hypothetical protein VJZ04_11315 [Lachnospiraceae bacterium]|nr:hypothetical protein [Lachnospiraceae bacterium]
MKLKYYIRGLGIGIMMTAFLMGINQSGQKEKLTNEEIMNRAKEIGMYERVVVSENTSKNEVKDNVSKNEVKDTDLPTSTDVNNEIIEPTEVIITINSGEGSLSVCKKLVQAKLIDDAAKYDLYLATNGYDKRIKVGNHVIPIGSSEVEIANIISSK